MGSATDLRFPLGAVVHGPAEPFGAAPGLPRAQKGRFGARREEPAKVNPVHSSIKGLLLPCTLELGSHLDTWGSFLSFLEHSRGSIRRVSHWGHIEVEFLHGGHQSGF